MRYSMAVTPANYLLFACHFVNFGGQATQLYRWYDYWYMGGQAKWNQIKAQTKSNVPSLDQAKDKMQEATKEIKDKTVGR